MDNNDYNKCVIPPKRNIEYPFFAYGIFKPGQLAFSNIEEYVDKISYNSINYEMYIRDGVPIIGEEDENFKTYGYLIKFKRNCEKEAYKIISATEPFDLYEWDEIKCDGVDCKVLKGKNFEKGSSPPEFDFYEFKGHKDPLFKEAFELIDNYLHDRRRIFDRGNEFSGEIKKFFVLQMHYMLLWAAIDRFCSLKYNQKKIADNNYRFSKDPTFINAFENLNIKRRRIYTTNNLFGYDLSGDDTSTRAINYYYKMRCNIVHRGKTISMYYSDVLNSMNELSRIFKEVLKNTFNIVTINDINFKIPYGLIEVSNENDSARIFKKDENNLIDGIPNYSIEIIDLSRINHDDEISIKSENIYKVGSKLFDIQIKGDHDKKDKIILHLNENLR